MSCYSTSSAGSTSSAWASLRTVVMCGSVRFFSIRFTVFLPMPASAARSTCPRRDGPRCRTFGFAPKRLLRPARRFGGGLRRGGASPRTLRAHGGAHGRPGGRQRRDGAVRRRTGRLTASHWTHRAGAFGLRPSLMYLTPCYGALHRPSPRLNERGKPRAGSDAPSCARGRPSA
jgi:hypothetical protein